MHQLEIAVGALWRYRRFLRAEAGEIERRQVELENVFGFIGFERLPRYEAHLLRIFYRALNELERLQRMRLGDAVPAPVVVDGQT